LNLLINSQTFLFHSIFAAYNIDWLAYYRAQAGGEYNYFHGSRFQEGYGLGGFNLQQGPCLGGMFRKFASWIIPMVKKYAVPS
jgi:hypothetical protein